MRRPHFTFISLLSAVALLATLLVTTSVLGGPTSTVSLTTSPATRVEPPAAARRRHDMHVVKRYRHLADVICVKKRTAHHRPGRCRRIAVLRESYRYHHPDSARTDGEDRYWCRDWSATMRGLYYVNWKEQAKGTFCWVEGPDFPDIYRNNWRCGYSSGIGYDVHVDDCWQQRRYGDTTAGWWISVYDKFRVSAAFRGFPLHWTYQFHVNLHPTGNTTLKVD